MIASVHVVIEKEAAYMAIGKRIKALLHAHGIHSTTVQPELPAQQARDRDPSRTASSPIDETTCLLRCDEDCGEKACCD